MYYISAYANSKYARMAVHKHIRVNQYVGTRTQTFDPTALIISYPVGEITCMCMCTCMCMYICMSMCYIYVYVYVYPYIHMHAYTRILHGPRIKTHIIMCTEPMILELCVYVCFCVHVRACVRACVCACVRACVCVGRWYKARTHTHTHATRQTNI